MPERNYLSNRGIPAETYSSKVVKNFKRSIGQPMKDNFKNVFSVDPIHIPWSLSYFSDHGIGIQ